MRLATCRACGKPVTYATVANKTGKPPGRMPLNPDPDPDGNVAAYKDATGRLVGRVVGRVVGKGGKHQGYERLMMPHFATCEKSDPTPLPGNVTQLDQWRKALSARAKTARQRRGRRPRPQITGVRWTP